MTDFRQQYKKKTLGFGNALEGRIIRAEKHTEDRKVKRAENFAKKRDILETASPDPQDKTSNATEDRMTKLMKWKQERDMRKKIQQQQKKPVFRVGVVHHGLNSPVFKDANNLPVNAKSTAKLCKLVKPQSTPLPRRTTRATEKRLAAKLAAATQPSSSGATSRNIIKSCPKEVAVKLNKTPSIKLNGRRTLKGGSQASEKKDSSKQSFAPENYQFKGPKGLPHLPLFGRAALEDVKVEKDLNEKEKYSKEKNGKENIASSTVPSPRRTFLFSDSVATKSVIIQKSPTTKTQSPQIVPHDTEELHTEKTDSDDEQLTCTTPNSSIETITLRLSPEEIQTLDGHFMPLKPNPKLGVSSKPAVVAKLQTPPTNTIISPYVVSSRGKSSARKEQQMRLGIGRSPSNEIPTKDTVMQNLNISIEDEERTAQYFTFILGREIDRLHELCEKWRKIMSDPDLPEDAQLQINQAIGQTNLLMKKKFERFRSLVFDCETGKGQMLVRCKDLQGFWDLIYMEVEDCDARFRKLETLMARGWEEELPEIVKKVIKKKTLIKKKVIPKKQSSVRAMILAARKKKVEQEDKVEVDEIESKMAKPSELLSVEFDGGFFTVRSPRKSVPEDCKIPTPRSTKKRASLLQKVQLAEAGRNMTSPLAVMKVNRMCKTPQVKLDDTITYVNSDQTPGRSILKRMEESSSSASRSTKSQHKVNFNDDVTLTEVPIDEEVQNKIDLAARLARIDTYDLEVNYTNEMEVRAEKKLNFSDDSFEDLEKGVQQSIERQANSFELGNSFGPKLEDEAPPEDIDRITPDIPEIGIEAVIPEVEYSPTRSIVGTKDIETPLLNSMKKTLRNLQRKTDIEKKTINSSRKSTKNHPTNEKQEETDLEQKENTTPGEMRWKSLLKTVKDDDSLVTEEIKPPRSRRSSVKNGTENIQVAEEVKTPRSRRKNSLKALKEDHTSQVVKEAKTPKGRRKSIVAPLSSITEQPSDNVTKRRKSTRKSVRFTGDECTVCANDKPVNPMTPHARRIVSRRSSKQPDRISLLGDAEIETIAPLANGELIAWDSPIDQPARVRRSRRISNK